MTPFLGYCKADEDHPALAAASTPFSLHRTFSAPHSISHRSWRKAKDQGRVGRCTGFSRASGEEVLNWIATGGQAEHFSGTYAYIQNQILDGWLGQDKGATINASVRAAKSTGICRASVFGPEPPTYTTSCPAVALTEGKKHLVARHNVLGSYDDLLQWIASGVGVVLIGVEWTTGMVNVGPKMELGNLGGTVLGGHALVIHGYDGDIVDKDGRPYADLENSHTEQWADDGFCKISPRVIDRWFSTGETLIGISDQETFGFREVKTRVGMTK